MGQSIRDFMTSNPCTIDADKTVAYAAKMMRDEDVGLAPIVEGDKLIGMLTDRDIAVRVAAQGRDPDQVSVRDVASKKLVTIDPQQDLDEALRIMAKHQVRRLPVVEEDGRLVGVVAQADIAREGDAGQTGKLVEEISESGGQMSSYEEGQFPSQVTPQVVEPVVPVVEEEREEEPISRVASTSRGRRRRTSTSRARSTTRRKSTGGRKKTTARKSTARKTTRKKSTARKSTARKTTSRKRAAAGRKGGRKTAARKTTARKTTRRKTTARKSTGRKTTRRKSTARKSTGRTTVRAAGRKGGRKTARRRTTRRKSSS